MEPQPTRLPVLKLIALALVLGVLIFTAIVVTMTLNRTGPVSGVSAPMFTLITIASGATTLPFAAAFGPIFAAAARRQWPARRDEPHAGDWLVNQYAVLTIIRLALAEGFGLLGAAGLMVTGRWPFLAAPLIAVVFMAVFFPTQARARAFITSVTGQVPH